MTIAPKFAYKKATNALNYFAIKSDGTINKMKAIKLVYLADRYHFRKYGRTITYSKYVAMPCGTVGSLVKNVAEHTDFLYPDEKAYAKKFIKIYDQYNIKSESPVEDKVFSKSDLEALEFSWKHFGHLKEFDLSKLTHKYPEWKKHKKEIEEERKRCVDIDLLDFLEDPEKGCEKCHDLNKKDKELLKEELIEFGFAG